MKKWKEWSVIIMVIMAAVLLIQSPVSALAQTGDEAVKAPKPLSKGALAIVAPRVAGVNQEISMTVFLRYNQEPFEGAGIWAFTREEAELLKEEIQAHRESNNQTDEPTDYESVAERHGRFLGRTDENGKLYHVFEQAGAYVLATFQGGYFPGFTGIKIRELPKALTIQAPRRASVGEEVTMNVSQRGIEEAIEGAGIWAVTRDNVEAFKEDMASLRENTEIAAGEKDYESVASVYGILLGWTDENGQLGYAFEEEGGYALIAVKPGYLPGFTSIHIVLLDKAEVLKKRGVPSNGLDRAPGLQKPFNDGHDIH